MERDVKKTHKEFIVQMKYKLNGDLKYSLNLSSGPALSLRINKKGPSLRAQKISKKNINIWFASTSVINIKEVTPTLIKEMLPIKSKKMSVLKKYEWIKNKLFKNKIVNTNISVSYTHLTLPTKRIV